MIYQKKNTPFMRSNAYTNCYEFMFVLSKGKPETFNPIKEKSVRSGPEPLPSNRRAEGITKKVLSSLKAEKTRNNTGLMLSARGAQHPINSRLSTTPCSLKNWLWIIFYHGATREI